MSGHVRILAAAALASGAVLAGCGSAARTEYACGAVGGSGNVPIWATSENAAGRGIAAAGRDSGAAAFWCSGPAGIAYFDPGGRRVPRSPVAENNGNNCGLACPRP